jgi:translation initiation factor 2 alpha subunit (eIF-2alpha)
MTLTRRRVSPEDIQACENKYNKSKMVHSILRHVAETTSSHKLDELYEVSWHFLRSPLLITCTDSWMASVQGLWPRV